VQHTSTITVTSQFLLERPEDLRIDRLQLKTRLVFDSAAALDAVGSLSSQTMEQ